MPALWISVVCISFSSLLLVHAFIRRAPWRKQPKSSGHGPAPSETSDKTDRHSLVGRPYSYPSNADSSNPPSPKAKRMSMDFSYDTSKDDLVIERVDVGSPSPSLWGGSTNYNHSRSNSVFLDATKSNYSMIESLRSPSLFPDNRGALSVTSPQSSTFGLAPEEPVQKNRSHRSLLRLIRDDKALSKRSSNKTLVGHIEALPQPESKVEMTTVTVSALPAPRMRAQPPPVRQRIDYLAGLVALCAILVTVMHFGLTFVPAIVIPGAHQHHPSEYWAQQIVAPFILNQMWLGVFFTTSVRFLVAPYLKKGNMQEVAKAAVRRTPRLMIPVATIALLEYFFVDVGATKFLRYLPSLTWSTWPFVERYPTAGHFISEVLELVYLIPNAVPQITFHYCTGVLWTIAVQLQGTWLVLCGVIVVYEIKTPWKRMAYYAFCVVNHWYAQTWGTYLWIGLLLTDLDITYKYKPYLHARPGIYYPLITLFTLCVAAGFSVNIIPNFVDFNFATKEHNIHPDASSGEAIMNTNQAGYPAYYKPRLNGLLFAAGMQAIVELSPAVQWLLSLPWLMILFPHIFTIYLLHGLVFWSWGSWLMVFLANRSFSYGINVAIVGVTSYVLLFAILPIVTPVIEALGKDLTAMIWMDAIEKHPPRRRTLFPFPDDFLSRREEKNDVEANGTGNALRTSLTPSEKKTMKQTVDKLAQEIQQLGGSQRKNSHPSIHTKISEESIMKKYSEDSRRTKQSEGSSGLTRQAPDSSLKNEVEVEMKEFNIR